MNQPWHATLVVARYTALEALRGRYGWLLLLITLAGFGLATFSGQLAITETRQIQAALTAATVRLAAVLLLAMFIVTSMAREFSDKTVELMLSLPLPRAGYFAGKLAGYSLVAVVTALPLTALIALFSSFPQSLYWGASLALELLIVCAASLTFAYSLGQMTTALSAVVGFYVLSRSIAAIQLMAHSPLDTPETPAQGVLDALVGGLAYLLPDLARFTRSDWLIYAPPAWGEMAALAGQSLVYLLLLSTVALFDLYRKNL